MNKLKNSGFWVAIVAFVIMLAQLFGVKIDAPYVNEIINSVCAVCVALGIGVSRSKTETEDMSDSKDSIKCEEESEKTNNGDQ